MKVSLLHFLFSCARIVVILLSIGLISDQVYASPALFRVNPIGGDFRLFYSALGPLRLEDTSSINQALSQELNQSSTSGMLTARFKLKGVFSRFKWEIHPLLLSRPQSGSSTVSLNANPSQFPQALPLSVDLVDSKNQLAQLRADRFLVTREFTDFKITLGRQAITLGQGRAFTPLDRLAPFSPTSIDQQYKPGLDALRLDYWWGVAGQLSLIAAYRQNWTPSGMAYAITGQDHFAGWDFHFVIGSFQKDRVIGLSTAGSLGAISIYGDFAWTWSNPDLIQADDEETFGRATLGMTWNWAEWGGGYINGEVYWQEDGASNTDLYLSETQDPRFLRGERWFLGRFYGMLSIQQALTPLFQAAMSLLTNLEDGSGLIGSNVVWSVGQDVDVVMGAYGGYGDGLSISTMALRPTPLTTESEFGALKWMGFAMMATYF